MAFNKNEFMRNINDGIMHRLINPYLVVEDAISCGRSGVAFRMDDATYGAILRNASPSSILKERYWKYRSLNHRNVNGVVSFNEGTEAIFSKKTLWYSAPCDFNDPYDCNLRLHANDSTDYEWASYIKKLENGSNQRLRDYVLSRSKASRMKQKLRKVKKEKLWKVNPDFVENVGHLQSYEIYNRSSVFCFSKKCDSILMFSHYADNHKGIVLEFEFNRFEVPCGFDFKDIGFNGRFYGGISLTFGDVNYEPCLPELNYHRIRDDERLVNNLMFVKFDEWTYEGEFRIFRRNIPKGAVPYKPELLKRIIFGARTTAEDIDLVKSWLSNWPSRITLSKAIERKDSFNLDIQDFAVI